MAGYSARPLAAKLGLKDGMRAHFKAAPDGYHAILGALPAGLAVSPKLTGTFDFIQCFVADAKTLERDLPKCKERLAKDGMLWVSWPKKSSALYKDLTEDGIRKLALGIGLVDVKVCAVDDDWSGLKLMYRVKDR